MNATRNLVLLCLAGLAGACTRADAGGPGSSPQAAGGYPEIDFSDKPSYLPDNVIVLTFDDGPDWTNTAKILDVLAERDVKATFFINTENWSNVNTEPEMQDLVRRMVNEGHELANHTVRHLSLPTLSAADDEAEIAGVENTVNTIFGAAAPRLTLFRAPFGEPYQDHMGYDQVAPIVAEHAVHIGWAIDTKDYECPVGDSACVIHNFTAALEAGSYGVVLLHSVWSQTATALPELLDYIDSHGYELWTTEQVVCARFGKSSARVVDGVEGGCEPQGGGGDIDAGPDGDDDSGDGGDDGTGDDDGPAGDDDGQNGVSSGCGCRTSGAGGPGGALLVLAVAVACARRRRRS